MEEEIGKRMEGKGKEKEKKKEEREERDGYLKQYGRPVALYADKHSIFRVNMKNCEAELTKR